jgi:hypothetical protein
MKKGTQLGYTKKKYGYDTQYVDSEFTPDASSIIWMDYATPKIKGEIGRYANNSWMRVPDLL